MNAHCWFSSRTQCAIYLSKVLSAWVCHWGNTSVFNIFISINRNIVRLQWYPRWESIVGLVVWWVCYANDFCNPWKSEVILILLFVRCQLSEQRNKFHSIPFTSHKQLITALVCTIGYRFLSSKLVIIVKCSSTELNIAAHKTSFIVLNS